jgi:hypothetical protein
MMMMMRKEWGISHFLVHTPGLTRENEDMRDNFETID